MSDHTAPIDLCVVAFVVHDDEVLLVEHAKLGCWLPPGGHVEPGETTDEALFREVREETGIALTSGDVIQPPRQPPASAFHNSRSLLVPRFVDIHDFPPVPGHRHLALVYHAEIRERASFVAPPGADRPRWFARDELADPELAVPDRIAWYAEDAIDSVKFLKLWNASGARSGRFRAG